MTAKRAGWLVVLAAAFLSVVAVTPAQADATAPYVISFTHPGARREAVDRESSLRRSSVVSPSAVAARLTDLERAELARVPGIAAVEPDATYRVAEVPNDPCYGVQSNPCTSGAWWVDRVGLPAAWDVSHGAGVVIAVIDAGVDTAAPELAGKLVGPEINLTNETAPPSNHGTAVAELAAAVTDNGIGSPGAGWASQLLAIKALRASGQGDLSTLVSAITRAVDSGASVINISAAGPPTVALAQAIDNAQAHGVVVVAAAGNDGVDRPELAPSGAYPAAYPSVIAVGATAWNDARADFSNFGPWVDVFAPGQSLSIATAARGTTTGSGTSLASPIVAGVVALLRARTPSLTPADVSAMVRRSALPVPSTGGGRLDAGALLHNRVPFGSLDVARFAPGGIHVGGWVIDPDAAGPTQAHVYLDGVGTALLANGPRPDVAAVFPYGPNHGFNTVLAASAGAHTTCAYGFNDGERGDSPLLGCQTTTVWSVHRPFGNQDAVSRAPGGVRSQGWAIDPDVADPIAVHVYADGAGVGTLANVPRSDITATFPAFGVAGHSYSVQVPVPPGSHLVCAYGIDVGPPPLANPGIGCTTVTIDPNPFGSLDLVQRSGNTVRVAGWAIDPDEAGPTQVHVYIDGRGVAVQAQSQRNDVMGVYPDYGPNHGFDATLALADPGPHTVCAYVINLDAGANQGLRCETI